MDLDIFLTVRMTRCAEEYTKKTKQLPTSTFTFAQLCPGQSHRLYYLERAHVLMDARRLWGLLLSETLVIVSLSVKIAHELHPFITK